MSLYQLEHMCDVSAIAHGSRPACRSFTCVDDDYTDAVGPPFRLQAVLRWLLPALVVAAVVTAGWTEFDRLDLHAIHRAFR